MLVSLFVISVGGALLFFLLSLLVKDRKYRALLRRYALYSLELAVIVLVVMLLFSSRASV